MHTLIRKMHSLACHPLAVWRGGGELQLLIIHLPLFFHAYVGTQDIARSKNAWDTDMVTNKWLYKSSLR